MASPLITVTIAIACLCACKGPDVSNPRAVLELVDTKSCLPTLPIPNRPPFAIHVEGSGSGAVRVRIQQLPDAYPPPVFDVEIAGAEIRLVSAPAQLLQGTVYCNVVVLVTGLPAGDFTLSVHQRDPATKHTRVLGTSPANVPG